MITVRKKKHYLNTDRVGYGFVLPALLFMGVFIVFPIVYNFILSFQQVDVMTLMSVSYTHLDVYKRQLMRWD